MHVVTLNVKIAGFSTALRSAGQQNKNFQDLNYEKFIFFVFDLILRLILINWH